MIHVIIIIINSLEKKKFWFFTFFTLAMWENANTHKKKNTFSTLSNVNINLCVNH